MFLLVYLYNAPVFISFSFSIFLGAHLPFTTPYLTYLTLDFIIITGIDRGDMGIKFETFIPSQIQNRIESGICCKVPNNQSKICTSRNDQQYCGIKK